MKILLAEDDKFTREGLVEIFESEGYEVVSVMDGGTAIIRFREARPDVVVLDIMMPKMNGYDVCKLIRKENTSVPIIFLSAKSEEIDKVLGLELGADDYISKPFGVKEVIARIRAVTRRVLFQGRIQDSTLAEEGTAWEGTFSTEKFMESPFTIGDLRVLPRGLKAVRGKAEIELSIRDMKILYIFAQNKGKVLDRDSIYNVGWGVSHLPNSRTLDQHISQLRKKIEKNPKKPEIITTVHAAGYRYP